MVINVSKPYLPSMDKYVELLEGIFSREWLTNNGPLVRQLEAELKDYLKIDNLLFVSNGTIALQLAIRALSLTGEVITTPFSYVATTSSIVWENCRPVMVDIDPGTLNIDPDKIRRAITPSTSAILATHVYGNPCDVFAIDEIAREYGLKVIYDAAHAFGTSIDGESIFAWGDISATSFHATKLFHTVEGGAVFARDPDVQRVLATMRSFGQVGEGFVRVGINAKNSEFHAAMGIVNLPHVDEILASRQALSLRYEEGLDRANLRRPVIRVPCTYNHAYFPVIFDSEAMLHRVTEALRRSDVFPRRYFFPSLSSLNYVGVQNTPISDDIACRVLALPLYFGLEDADVDRISSVIVRECGLCGADVPDRQKAPQPMDVLVTALTPPVEGATVSGRRRRVADRASTPAVAGAA
ncbi:DegT/DnrJ/EryC1/StrS family aminotransferase [Caballeronia sp. LjRoot31]|jgi:dTDP-4-amino-4,6-dideoxygalactose transaminase|uniref:DegT/DnrJ/EryC1/StrS family aminotransferase n=1 Tax=Caballeronia sp. LjRoot31 TaxID=3342324 RepID=UPI003ECD0A7B